MYAAPIATTAAPRGSTSMMTIGRMYTIAQPEAFLLVLWILMKRTIAAIIGLARKIRMIGGGKQPKTQF